MSSHFLRLPCAQIGLSNASLLPPSALTAFCTNAGGHASVWTRLYWQDARKHAAWKRDPRSSPHAARHALNGIWAWKKQRQLQSSAELFGGCSYSLIWQQSWEIIWISLVSVECLSGFSADRVPSGMFLCCVRVWVPCVAWFVCFAFLGSSFSCCLHVGFLFGDKKSACVCG